MLAAGTFAGADIADSGSLLVMATGGAFSVPVVSMAEARFQTIEKQQYDFSCGAAAVATVLTHHYGFPTDEKSVFEGMYRTGDQQKIEREGFSMLEMKNYLTSMGIRSQGFEADLEQISEVGLPTIVLININGYMHFVVVKGISRSGVLVGDPALGLKRYDREEFSELRVSKVALFIVDAIDKGTKSFNDPREWGILGMAPMTTAVRHNRLMGTRVLNLPARNEF